MALFVMNYIGRVEAAFYNGAKLLYDIIIGDSSRHKRWQEERLGWMR